MLKMKDLQSHIFDSIDPWGSILASIAYAVHCSYRSTLKGTPGQLIFGHDMLLNIKFHPNFKQVWKEKQDHIVKYNARENSKRTGECLIHADVKKDVSHQMAFNGCISERVKTNGKTSKLATKLILTYLTI